jgi:hypothetical protein
MADKTDDDEGIRKEGMKWDHEWMKEGGRDKHVKKEIFLKGLHVFRSDSQMTVNPKTISWFSPSLPSPPTHQQIASKHRKFGSSCFIAGLHFHDQRVRGQRHALTTLYPREKPGTHCIGGWVGPRAGLDRCGKSRPQRDSIPGPSSP